MFHVIVPALVTNKSIFFREVGEGEGVEWKWGGWGRGVVTVHWYTSILSLWQMGDSLEDFIPVRLPPFLSPNPALVMTFLSALSYKPLQIVLQQRGWIYSQNYASFWLPNHTVLSTFKSRPDLPHPNMCMKEKNGGRVSFKYKYLRGTIHDLRAEFFFFLGRVANIWGGNSPSNIWPIGNPACIIKLLTKDNSQENKVK